MTGSRHVRGRRGARAALLLAPLLTLAACSEAPDAEPVPEVPRLLLVDFFDDGTILGVAADGSLRTGLADGSWEAAGASAGEGLQALTVGPDGTVWVLDGGGLRRSTDRGRTLEAVPGW